MARPYYESDRGVSEYLLLHYGDNGQPVLPPGGAPSAAAAKNFPARSAALLRPRLLPDAARALDLGCAVGRSSFELARHCDEVIGIDYSRRFINVAQRLQKEGSLPYQSWEEGELQQSRRAVVPPGLPRPRVHFQRGDAMNLPSDLGTFDAVLMANLIDRLSEPRRCLDRLRQLVNPGGQLIITSPYTWLPEYTPRRLWLGGFTRRGQPVKTLDALGQILAPDFKLVTRRDVPFLIREHARKYQFSAAEATLWLRV